jgi:imidazolonepropionase-like amidohydrolase
LGRIESVYAKAGARYLAGSGTTAFGTIPGVSLHTELELMRKAGVPPRAVLAAATSAFGQTFGWPNLGEIKAGYDADLLVLDADPLGDVANLRAIRMVILNGVVLDREKLRAGR